MYVVELSERARKQLLKLDKHVAKALIAWMRKNLENCVDPHALGKPLVGDRRGTWRYRVGDYRIITEINDGVLLILVVAIGNRKDIYN